MTKRIKIIYWIATIWLALGMLSTGIVQLLKMDEEAANFKQLGYPVYLLTLLGVLKLLGVVAVLIPRFPVLKEWAYAGFFFAMSGATYSRMVSGGTFSEIAPSLLLLVLTGISWYLRPADRKLVSAYQ
ncbi:MAG: DoxX family protein [Cytophagales bacterium]|nr:MAG: DoxX family protein [Cytophagales bacterium]